MKSIRFSQLFSFRSSRSSDFSSTDDIVKSSNAADDANEPIKKDGINVTATAFFVVAQVAGAGFLALPSAFAATGWIGLPMLLLFCVSLAFSGTRLGACWVILEERWEEYRKPSRQAYMDIAFRSFGPFGRTLVLFCVLITLIGTTIIYMILIAEFFNSLVPTASLCLVTVIFAVVAIPFSWLGTPKDMWQASVLAALATAFACIVIFIQLMVDIGSEYVPENPKYPNPTFTTFSTGFGIITAAYGGLSAFPTFQNDMKEKTKFWKSVFIAYIILILLYLPVAVGGYAVLGEAVPDNILLYRTDNLTIAVKIAIGFQIINLMGSFLITFNPVGLILEELFKVPPKFGIKRVLLRSFIILFDLVVALAIPDFSLVLNLVGGSTLTICSFVMPPLMYMKLVGTQTDNKQWPQRVIPKWEKIFLIEIIIVGIIGGVCSTYTAFKGIIQSEFGESCFSNFARGL